MELRGTTNVGFAPKHFPYASFRLGEHVFASTGALAVPLEGLHASVGERIDGILGMSDLSTVDFILRDRELVLAPSQEACAHFGPDASAGGDALSPTVVGVHDGKRIPFLVDSGSSFTFVDTGLWRASTNAVSLSAAQISGTGELCPHVGEPGELDLGAKLAIRPMVVPRDVNYLGADVLKSCDILFRARGRGIFFRPLRKDGAGEARWISYPGDYGIWWGNRLQSERLQWGARLTPFWPLYEPHVRVLFRKDVRLDADEPLEIRADGNAAVCWRDGNGGYTESAALLGRFTLPKDATSIELKVYNAARPPAVWVKGPHLVSDSSWNASWTMSADASDDVPCEVSSRFGDPRTPPGLARLPTRAKKPVRCAPPEGIPGMVLAADFGEETYGYVRFHDVKGSGAVKVIYAESAAELRAVDLANTEKGALDGWEMLELSGTREYRREIAHGFRYVGVVRVSGDVTIGAISMEPLRWMMSMSRLCPA